MDGDSCAMDCNEVAPLGSDRNCSVSSDFRYSLCHIKVCVHFILHLSALDLPSVL